MKVKKFFYWLFVFLILAVIAYGGYFVFNNVTVSTSTFTSDGYAVFLKGNSVKTSVETFTSGTEYNYKKYDDKVTFVSNDNNNVSLDNNTGIHYQNNGILLLKNVVGIDLSTIGNELIFYYNLFQDTEIAYDNVEKSYYVENIAKEKIEFKKLLLRFDDNKFLIAGDDVRVVLSNKQIVDFGNYLYFEYTNGSVIKLYSRDKYYQTIPTDASIVVGNNTIDLDKKYISIDNNNMITLSNLVIDMDGNIDVVTEKSVSQLKIDKADVSKDILSGNGNEDIEISGGGSGGTSQGGSSGSSNSNNNNNNGSSNQEEIVVDDSTIYKEPVFKVSSFSVTAMKVDAVVEIIDNDMILLSPIEFSIVENTTGKIAYENSLTDGNYYLYLSYPDLNPDTEYTLFGKASYKVDNLIFEKIFLSKIFRTEALGVSFEKSYATKDSIILNVKKESYSKVSSATIGIYDDDATLLDYEIIDFATQGNNVTLTFNELEHNSTYTIKMYDVICSGVRVNDRFLQSENIMTLKKVPTIEGLSYRVSKINSAFELEVGSVTDEDYGIYNYRYEIFDARQDLSKDNPITVIERPRLMPVTLEVDDVVIRRGVAYTYRLVVEFNDNEKNVEYITDLGEVMQLDGVAFPTLRWDPTNVTWEQIEGTIVIEDPKNTVVSDTYKVVYKNSIDLYVEDTITTETSAKEIPIDVNYLRANETYTFDVYATINLQDGNLPANQTYIGSVKVQTGAPRRLRANFIRNNIYSDIFSIDFNLTDDTENASFEASTLKSLTFTIYQGSTTDGKVEVFKKEIDSIDNEYVSSLKRDFYDATKTLNADFFDSDNSDYRQTTYTLVVDEAYDYTGYASNIIPIENNVFQFQVNHYVPPLPEDGVGQAAHKIIYNRNATSYGFEYDSELPLNTPVGVSVTGTFDNSANSARYMKYYVYRKNQFTNEYEHLENLDETIYYDENGAINSLILPIGNGTPVDDLDSDMLRRGNNYYISYEVYIDLDNDGNIDTVYPNDIDSEFVLRSNNFVPSKNSAVFKLYPSTSTADSFSWRYFYNDVDHALSENKLYGFTNSSEEAVSSADIEESDEYNVVTFTGLAAGETFSIKKHEKLNKISTGSYDILTSQYFYGKTSTLDLTYTLSNSNNNLVLAINDYDNNSELTRLISSVDVIITPVDAADLQRLGILTLESYPIRSGRIMIDYYSLIDYFNIDLEVSLIVHYDNGVTGFDDFTQKFAIQSGTYSEIGNYYAMSSSSIAPTGAIYGNYFSGNFNPNDRTLYLINKANLEVTLDVIIDETGVMYGDNNILIKSIADSELSTNDNTFKFNSVVPGISLYNDSNKLSIVSLLDSAYIDATFYTYDVIDIQDDYVYGELYQTDENGTNSVFDREIQFSISDFDEPLYIDNLMRMSSYYIKFYANIYNIQTGQYTKQYLYDVNQKLYGCRYNFRTLSDVGFGNINVNFVANSYRSKKVSVDYTLDNITGYDYIKYELFVWNGTEYVPSSISIRDSIAFYRDMHIDIDGSPKANNEIKYGGKYKIRMSAYGVIGTTNGEEDLISLGTAEEEFEIERYDVPYISITSGKAENSIYFRVTVNDTSYVVYNGMYTVDLRDSDNNLVVRREYSINEINRKIVFSKDEYDLVDGMDYRFTVSVNNDYNNEGGNFTLMSKSKVCTYGEDVYLGTTIIKKSPDSNSRFEIIFVDPYKINQINRVSYSINSVTTGYYYSNTDSFYVTYDPTLNIYTYVLNLPDSELVDSDVYLFSFNFYRGNSLVKELELSYYLGVSDETG